MKKYVLQYRLNRPSSYNLPKIVGKEREAIHFSKKGECSRELTEEEINCFEIKKAISVRNLKLVVVEEKVETQEKENK